jgi:hypothetical protein
MHQTSAGGSFIAEHGNTIKPASTDSYNLHKGHSIKETSTGKE